MSKKTSLESAFEEYLDSAGYEYEFEPIQSETLKRPDYELVIDGGTILVEAKQIADQFDYENGPKACNYDPYKPVIAKIKKAATKFSKLGDRTCVLLGSV